MGYFTHELGHLLYTDFLTKSMYLQYFKTQRWYPVPPLIKTMTERMNEADIWHFCKDDEKRTAVFLKLAFHLVNILEDGYIEGKMLNRYPGVLGSNLSILREDHFENYQTLTQLIEYESDGGHIWLTMESLFLSYAKYGELKYGDEPLTDKRIQTVFSLLSELDKAVTDPSMKERWNVVNIIMIRCWEDIKDFIEKYIEMADEAAASAGGGTSASTEEMISRVLDSLFGTSTEGIGDTSPIEEAKGSTSTTPGKSKRKATAKMAAASDPSEPEKEDESEETGTTAVGDDESKEETEVGAGFGEEPESEDESGGDISIADDSEESEESETGLSGEIMQDDAEPNQNVSSEEKGRIPLEQTNELYNPTGGGIETDDEYEGSGYTNAAADIERLLEDMAERSVHTELEKDRTSHLNELAQNISYGDIHSGVTKRVHRMAEVSDDMKEKYRMVAPQLLHISKLLQRSIKQQLQDKRNGGKQTGLLMGRRLDARALPRNDGRVFYKNNLPNNTPEISIGLLLDESGSMCSCDRATYARMAAIILYDFCKALNIPVMVYGHSGNYGVDLYSYAEFETIDRDDCYRLMDISARSQNRDGAALRFVAEQLSKRHEDIRILILVSDGQPSDIGYGGTAAEEDLRGIKQEYTRKGILFIAAAIGNDKNNIERIYGDSYLDITDLSKLPVSLTNIVKRHIRV